MKKLFAIGLFLTGIAVMSQAQTAPATTNPATTKQETKKDERKKMMADLNLTSDQAKQMKDISKDFKDKARAIKDNQSLGKKEKKQQLLALNKERSDKMNSFLTPEQQSKLKEDKKAARKKG
jgi:Spy/CpxP family protein refolding chaperone